MKLAIIGTAGRAEDGEKLTSNYYRSMLTVAQTVKEVIGATTLVSGGAAWADHLAVSLFLQKDVKELALHLPAEFKGGKFVEDKTQQFDAGGTANHYHQKFKEKAGVNSLSEIQDAILLGADISVNPGGFKARNSDVANEAHAVLAFTFSGEPLPKDGGTRDTWDKFAKKEKGGLRWAYHFDLISKKLYRHDYR